MVGAIGVDEGELEVPFVGLAEDEGEEYVPVGAIGVEKLKE